MHTFINELKKGIRQVDFYFLKSLNLKTSKNNNKYLDMTLADVTGEIDAKKWDIDEGEEDYFKAGDVVKVEFDVTLWMDSLQAKVIQMRKVEARDEVNYNDLIPSAPIHPKVMMEEIEGYIEAMKNEEIKAICLRGVEENYEKLLYYPAAKMNHHSIRSGLLYHLVRMMRVGRFLCELYGANWDLLFAGILFHDMEKLNEMKANKLGIVEEYTVEGNLIGHITQGIVSLDRWGSELGTDKEVLMLIKHMVLSHHSKPEYGSPKPPMFLEAELLHYIDDLDASVYDFQKAVENVSSGSFSDKVFSLDNRRIYRVNLDETISEE